MAGLVVAAGCGACAFGCAYVLAGGRVGPGAGQAPDLLARARASLGERRTPERARVVALREMPVMIDILTLGLSAGLSFDASLELYCARREGPLADALGRAMLEWRIGTRTRSEALARAADELGVPALRSFADVVGESLELGSPLAETLGRQASTLRDEQRSEVEEQIEKVPVRMLVPLGTLIVPAMLLAIVGPLLGSVAWLG